MVQSCQSRCILSQELGKPILRITIPTIRLSRFQSTLLVCFICALCSGCGAGRRGLKTVEPVRSEKTVTAQAFLYDLRIVDGSRTRTGKAELYAIPDTAILRVKGYLGSLGAIVFAQTSTLSVYLPREKQFSVLTSVSDSTQISCNSIWRLWPLLLRPSVSGTELDSLHTWTIVNRSQHRQQLLWQHPLCSLTVMVKAREMEGLWHFEEITASQVDGYIRLSLREHRNRATVPTSRFHLPDTSGWSEIAPDELSLSLDD